MNGQITDNEINIALFTQVYMCMKVHQAVSIKFVYFTIFRSFLKKLLWRHWASLIAQLVKNPPATQETLVQFLGREDPLVKGKAIHSSILAWRNIVHGVAKRWT